MKHSIVRSVSIDHSRMLCKKLKNRSVIRSITPDIRSSRPKDKLDSPVLQHPDKLSYDPKSRKVIMPLIGEVNLPREEFHLVQPGVLNSPTFKKKEKYSKLEMKVPKILQDFIRDSKRMFRSRRNYFSSLQKSIKDLKTLNVANEDFEDVTKVIHSKAFQDPKSKIFIKAAKSGNLEIISSLLKENPYIVQSFDFAGLTALHWSALRNKVEVAKLLLNNHAIIDAVDMVNRTPLLLAIKRENFDLIQFFLINKANPNIVPNPKKTIVDYSGKYLIQEILRKALTFHKQMLKVPENQRDEKWKTEIVPRFLNFDSIKPIDLKFSKQLTFASFQTQ